MGNDRLLRFGVFEFDPSGLQLCKAQRPVRLRPQALKLLRIFVSHPRQLITRDTIHQELWGSDVHVDFEQGVNHTIKQLRAALGDDANAPRYIETLPRLGYRFIAPVEFVSGPLNSAVDPSAGTTTGWPLAGPRALLAAAGVVVIAGLLVFFLSRAGDAHVPLPVNSTLAVIPFDVAGVDGQPGYLGVSLADAVIGRLATGGAIRVRPVAATRPYGQGSPDVIAVGRALRVDYVLTGTLRRAGGRDRAQLRLLDAATARAVWSSTVDVAASDLIDLESAISQRVAAAFQANGTPGRGRTEDPLAFQAYLQGRAYLAQLTTGETLAATAAFERALAVDSRYALAHAGLAKASATYALPLKRTWISGGPAPSDMRGGHSNWRAHSRRHTRRLPQWPGTRTLIGTARSSRARKPSG